MGNPDSFRIALYLCVARCSVAVLERVLPDNKNLYLYNNHILLELPSIVYVYQELENLRINKCLNFHLKFLLNPTHYIFFNSLILDIKI